MKKLTSTLIVAATFLSALPLLAQRHRLSPHETISAVVNGDRITITYGRPHTKSPFNGEMRKIWGGLVPYGKPWRMGADEATLLITQKPLEIDGKTIPAGAYTLYMLPVAKGPAHSQLAFSTAIGGWGIPVNTSHDLTRVDLKQEALEKPVHQYTMAIERSGSGGVLKMMWESTEYSVSFAVKK